MQRQPAVEELRERLLVLAVGHGGVARDGGFDAAGMHARHLDRMPGDQHLLAQRLGEAAHRVMDPAWWRTPATY